MKKKIVAAFCLAMVMTVGGCSGAGTAAQPESSESQTQPASVSESSSSSDASEENSTQKSASSTASIHHLLPEHHRYVGNRGSDFR